MVRRLIRTNKKESWKKCANSIETEATVTLALMVEKKHTFTPITKIRHEWISYKEDYEIANAFCHLLRIYVRYLPIHYQVPASQNIIRIAATIEELPHSLHSVKPNKTPGPNNIPIHFLKNLIHESKQRFLDIYNKIWTDSIFLSLWSSAIVIPLIKPGKNKIELTYRPIALTCIPCKVLEKMISLRLTKHLEEINF